MKQNYKTPTNMESNPLETQRQIAMKLHRVGHGCSFWVIYDLFWVSIWSAVANFCGR